ncbi:MAG TPA: metallophosphoesterase, partial [Limnochorda sp.]
MSGLGWSVAALAGGLLAWALLEPLWPRVDRRRLDEGLAAAEHERPPRHAEEAPPRMLRILHLADPHLRGLGLRERRVLTLARRLEPDLICLTGDFIARPQGLAVLEGWLSGLAGVAPVFAVLGDHDLLLPPGELAELEQTLRRAGVHLLRNRSSWVSGPGWRVWVVGVDDAGRGTPDLARAMAG